MARKSFTTAACRCASRSTPSYRGWRARRSPKAWCVSTRRKAGAGRSPRSIFPETGASSSPTSRRWPMWHPGGSRWCSRRATSRPASAFFPCGAARGAGATEAHDGSVPLDGVKWARTGGKPVSKVGQVLNSGDVVYVEPAKLAGQYRLHQVPEVSGAMVVEDPWTGRVLAMVGGFSYDQSQFNRATQALPQPGSSFKPIVYAAALDNGYTPSTLILDGPIEVDQGPGLGTWKPENYENNFYGPSTLRFGVEHSRNVMTVRLAQDVGMPLIAEYAKRFGVYDELPPYLSFALGAGETTLMRMVTAYAMFDNGGRRVKPTLIDRIQDRYGHTSSSMTSVN